MSNHESKRFIPSRECPSKLERREDIIRSATNYDGTVHSDMLDEAINMDVSCPEACPFMVPTPFKVFGKRLFNLGEQCGMELPDMADINQPEPIQSSNLFKLQ